MQNKNEKEKVRCKARRRDGTPCKNWAMTGKKVCRLHGGKSDGAPKGNKNALKTGRYEKIIYENLFDEEKEYFDTADTTAATLLDEEIKLTRIRCSRFLARIKTVQEKMRSETESRQMLISGGSETKTTLADGSITDSKSINYISLEARLLQLESDLTSIQSHLARLIERRAIIVPDSGNAAMSGVMVVPAYDFESWCKKAEDSQAELKRSVRE